MPTLRSSQNQLKKSKPAKKPKKAAQSKPSATSEKSKKSSLNPSPSSRFERYRKLWPQVLKQLYSHYPDAHCALNHENPFQLLVATILSAQCTDERVNKVTPALFESYPNPNALAEAPIENIEKLIGSVNFFRNKAKSLKQMSQKLVQHHGAEVPPLLEALIQLDGVGRKTANVVLGNAFNIATGVVVDTHVGRLAQRLAWTQEKDPVKIEQDLQKLLPETEWIQISHLLIFHGRQLCKARNPDCDSCFMVDLCPRIGVE